MSFVARSKVHHPCYALVLIKRSVTRRVKTYRGVRGCGLQVGFHWTLCGQPIRVYFTKRSVRIGEIDLRIEHTRHRQTRHTSSPCIDQSTKAKSKTLLLMTVAMKYFLSALVRFQSNNILLDKIYRSPISSLRGKQTAIETKCIYLIIPIS